MQWLLLRKALLVGHDHFPLVEIDGLRQDRIRDLDVFLLEVDADGQAVDDKEPSKCSRIRHYRPNVRQEDRKNERDQGDREIEENQIALPHFLVIVEKIE